MANVLQLVSFRDQGFYPILGIGGKTEQADIITITNVDTYSIDTDSVFDRVAEDYFGQNYTDTRLNQDYKTSVKVKHSEEPFSIKAGSNYILGKGSWLHAQSYVNNVEWATNFSITDFRNCWKIDQKPAVKITADSEEVDCGVLSVPPRETVTFNTIVDYITYTLDQPGLTEYLSSQASRAFDETTFSANAGDPKLDVTLKPVTWQSVQIGSNTVTFNQVHLSGSISNSYKAPLFVQFRLYPDFNLYKIFASVTAKAQIYDHASDAYDFANIYGNNRFYYLYYGSSSDATSKTNCLSFTSSRFEDPEHPDLEMTSDALASSTRKPLDRQLEPYKPSSSYVVSSWETQFPYVYDDAFSQDSYVNIYIKNVIPEWVNPDSTGLTLRSVTSDNLYYTSSALANNSFLDHSNGVETKKLTIPADASSVSRTLNYYSNNTGRLIKAVYTGEVIDSFSLNDSSMTTADKLSLQNRYLQILISSNDTTMPQVTITGSAISLSRTPLPVAIKFDFESSTPKVEVYFYAKFNSSSSSEHITWRITSSYNLSLVLRTRKAGTTSNLGQNGQLLQKNRYYSFDWPKGYSKSGSTSVAFDALFDASLDKVSFVDVLPDKDSNYSLDPWNKAYPSNYSLIYETTDFSPQEYRMGIIDSNFSPNFNWTSRDLAANSFEIDSGVWKSVSPDVYGTIYKLGLITKVSNGEISYTLRIAAKDLSGTYNTYKYDYSVSSPLILLKISAAGGNGGYSTTGSPYKGGGGGGSGAAAWVLLDLTYTNWTDTASRESSIYVFLGTKNRRTETEIKNKALSSFISFEEPVYNSSSTEVSVPSRDYIKLGPGNDGKRYEDENKQNFGGTGGAFSVVSEVDGTGSNNWRSYCYILQSCNGANGGRGENNSGESGGSSANPGNSFNKTCYSVRNRYSKLYHSSIFTDVASFEGGGIHVHNSANPERTFSPGGGGASSAFNSATTIEGQEPTATSIRGAGGTGGCYYNYSDGTANDSPSYGGTAYARIYCLLKSN